MCLSRTSTVSERAAPALVICEHLLKGAAAFSCQSSHMPACKISTYTLKTKWMQFNQQPINLFGCVWDLSVNWSQSWNDLHEWSNISATVWWISSLRINQKLSKIRFFFLHSCGSSGWIGRLEEKRMASPCCHNDPGWWSIYEFRQIKHPWCPAAWGHLACFKVAGYQTFAEAWAAPFN